MSKVHLVHPGLRCERRFSAIFQKKFAKCAKIMQEMS